MENEQFRAQVNQYKAALAKAQADLAQKQVGSRSEEIASAQAKVAAAQANLAQAQAKLNRATEQLKHNQELAQEGAISWNSLEELLSNKREAKANLDAEVAHLQEQRENLQQLRNGTRKEEIASGGACRPLNVKTANDDQVGGRRDKSQVTEEPDEPFGSRPVLKTSCSGDGAA